MLRKRSGMASNITKSVAARVPLDFYVELMDEAKERGVKMNDLILYKLRSKDRIVIQAPPRLESLDLSRMRHAVVLMGDLLAEVVRGKKVDPFKFSEAADYVSEIAESMSSKDEEVGLSSKHVGAVATQLLELEHEYASKLGSKKKG